MIGRENQISKLFLESNGNLKYAPIDYHNSILKLSNGELALLSPEDLQHIHLSAPEKRLLHRAKQGDVSQLIHYILDWWHSLFSATGFCSDYAHLRKRCPSKHEFRDLTLRYALRALYKSSDPGRNVYQIFQLVTILEGESQQHVELFDAVANLKVHESYFANIKSHITSFGTRLPPAVTRGALAYYSEIRNDVFYLEILKNVDPSTIDFNDSFRYCQQNNLTSGILYLEAVSGNIECALTSLQNDPGGLQDIVKFVCDNLEGHFRYKRISNEHLVDWAITNFSNIIGKLGFDEIDHLLDKVCAAADREHLGQLREAIASTSGSNNFRIAQVLLVLQHMRYPDVMSVPSSSLHEILTSIFSEEILGVPLDSLQNAIIHLIKALSLPSSSLLELVSQCENYHYWNVAEYIYRVENDICNLVRCYINNPARSSEVTSVIENFLAFSDEEHVKRSLQEELINLCPNLLRIHLPHFAHIIKVYFPDSSVVFYRAAKSADSSLATMLLLELAFVAPCILPHQVLREAIEIAVEKSDTFASELVGLHLPYIPLEEMIKWLEVSKKSNASKGSPRTTARILDHLGKPKEALQGLLHQSRFERDRWILALRVCNTHEGDLDVWEAVVAALFENQDTSREIVQRAFRDMRQIGSVCGQCLRHRNFTWTRSLKEVLIQASQAHAANLSTCCSMTNICNKERNDLVFRFSETVDRGWALSKDPVCLACDEPTNRLQLCGNWKVWECGHSVHEKCSSGIIECIACHPNARSLRHVKEIRGKGSIPRASSLHCPQLPTNTMQSTPPNSRFSEGNKIKRIERKDRVRGFFLEFCTVTPLDIKISKLSTYILSIYISTIC
jgi:hypothetical protein